MAELPQEFFNRIEEAFELAEEKAYKQGRADKYQEITSEYMLLTEKQVEEIRADAIEECKKIVKEKCTRNCMLSNCVECMCRQFDELKEKKNERW